MSASVNPAAGKDPAAGSRLEAELAANPLARELLQHATAVQAEQLRLVRDFIESHAELRRRRAAIVRRLVAISREDEATWLWRIFCGADAAERQRLEALGLDPDTAAERAGSAAVAAAWVSDARSWTTQRFEVRMPPIEPAAASGASGDSEERDANIRAHDAELALEELRAELERTKVERDRFRADADRLQGVLLQIDGGDTPCTDESTLRQWAYEAVTLGRGVDELSPAGGAR